MMRAAAALLLAAVALVAAAEDQVCRFPAGSRDDPFRRWLSSDELTCTPAGSATWPSGDWNVFFRGPGGISVEPLLVEGTPPEAPPLRPAATIVPQLPAGHRGVVYVPRQAIAYPTGERVLVPAEEELWLLVVERGAAAGLLPIKPLQRGEVRRVDATNAPAAVLGWLAVPEGDRAAIAGARGLASPAIEIASGPENRSADPLPPLDRLHGSFFRITGTSPGRAEVRLAGRGWLADRRPITVREELTTISSPMAARPAASLIVNWSASDDVPELDRSIGDCDSLPRAAQFEITVSSCAPPKSPREPVDPATCSPVAQRAFDERPTFGSFSVDDVPPGFYRAELKFGKLPPVAGTSAVAAVEQGPLRVNASYIRAYGSLTHGGKPIEEKTTIEFPRGYGFLRAGESEYRAALVAPVGVDAPITVSACDGQPHARILTDTFMRGTGRLDIDIPDNELEVVVLDTFTREMLAGATIRYSVMSLRVPRRPVIEGRLATDHSGRAAMDAVPEREIRLEVSHAGYQRQHVDPFTMPRREKKSVEVQLVPLRGMRGRIVSSVPFDRAAVWWFSNNGNPSERVEVSSDGTFVYARPHGPEETMAVVSASHPLWVVRLPRMERRETITVRFPDVPIRSFEVTRAGAERDESRHVGLAIGGIIVPQPALREHLFLRQSAAVIRGSGPLHIRDIAESGPIEVILGPPVADVPQRIVTMDLFSFPQYADSPRKRLQPGSTRADF